MEFPIGEAIIIGSTLFSTMGVVIKVMSVKENKSVRAENGNNGLGHNGIVVLKSLDELLETKLGRLVTEGICKARHTGLERHVSDMNDNLKDQLVKVENSQIRIFEKLEQLLKCQNAMKGEVRKHNANV